MKQQFTAVYQKKGKWYLGWVEEISGVNTQGKTLAEARANLQEALGLILDVNQLLLKRETGTTQKTIRESLILQRV
ncbi:MAG: type II toxin-antitoxin system HicB family antitoxin [Candidatus Magasanikbacteria bacterium]|nr:type II toxin-antitoxin system HicB family antitoxin [Candidatus Magasanikbacteria bacterium]